MKTKFLILERCSRAALSKIKFRILLNPRPWEHQFNKPDSWTTILSMHIVAMRPRRRRGRMATIAGFARPS
ncbi:MAG TPA: hypothetical protein V6C78_08270, partial [Crinalium sp.]